MTKNEIREKVKEIKKDFTKDYLRESDERITNAVLNSTEFRCADTVFVYVSVGTEPDTRKIIEYALSHNKTVCVPLCDDDVSMSARIIRSLDDVSETKNGLLEPKRNSVIVPPSRISLCIVPCVAADKFGNRVGHGGGFYDKFLRYCRAKKIILCHDRLVFEMVPTELFDVRCNKVIY